VKPALLKILWKMFLVTAMMFPLLLNMIKDYSSDEMQSEILVTFERIPKSFSDVWTRSSMSNGIMNPNTLIPKGDIESVVDER